MQNKTLEIAHDTQIKIDHNYRIAIQGLNGMILPQDVADNLGVHVKNLANSGDLADFIHNMQAISNNPNIEDDTKKLMDSVLNTLIPFASISSKVEQPVLTPNPTTMMGSESIPQATMSPTPEPSLMAENGAAEPVIMQQQESVVSDIAAMPEPQPDMMGSETIPQATMSPTPEPSLMAESGAAEPVIMQQQESVATDMAAMPEPQLDIMGSESIPQATMSPTPEPSLMAESGAAEPVIMQQQESVATDMAAMPEPQLDIMGSESIPQATMSPTPEPSLMAESGAAEPVIMQQQESIATDMAAMPEPQLDIMGSESIPQATMSPTPEPSLMAESGAAEPIIMQQQESVATDMAAAPEPQLDIMGSESTPQAIMSPTPEPSLMAESGAVEPVIMQQQESVATDMAAMPEPQLDIMGSDPIPQATIPPAAEPSLMTESGAVEPVIMQQQESVATDMAAAPEPQPNMMGSDPIPPATMPPTPEPSLMAESGAPEPVTMQQQESVATDMAAAPEPQPNMMGSDPIPQATIPPVPEPPAPEPQTEHKSLASDQQGGNLIPQYMIDELDESIRDIVSSICQLPLEHNIILQISGAVNQLHRSGNVENFIAILQLVAVKYKNNMDPALFAQLQEKIQTLSQPYEEGKSMLLSLGARNEIFNNILNAIQNQEFGLIAQIICSLDNDNNKKEMITLLENEMGREDFNQVQVLINAQQGASSGGVKKEGFFDKIKNIFKKRPTDG